MSTLDLTVKLTQLADEMESCYVKIDKTGKIFEKFPEALSRVADK